jgi:hypothetical protein
VRKRVVILSEKGKKIMKRRPKIEATRALEVWASLVRIILQKAIARSATHF